MSTLIFKRGGHRRGRASPIHCAGLLFVSLTACHHSDTAVGAPILCRPPGATAMTKDCTVEHANSPEGVVLTVRHPDGSFRRLLQVRDGRGVIAADGAEPAKVSAADGNTIDVDIGGALYRLPARVTP